MFKRVKSLVLAGALVLGMAVPAFAAEYGELTPRQQATYDEILKNYKAKITAGTRDDNTGIRFIGKLDYVSNDDMDKFVNSINNNNNNGLRVFNEPCTEGDHNDCNVYKVVFDSDFDGDPDEDANDVLIEVLHVEINNEKIGDKGVFDDITLETGDMIAYGGLAIAVIAGAGLYISNKKRK